jgi:hypothetical protein
MMTMHLTQRKRKMLTFVTRRCICLRSEEEDRVIYKFRRAGIPRPTDVLLRIRDTSKNVIAELQNFHKPLGTGPTFVNVSVELLKSVLSVHR